MQQLLADLAQVTGLITWYLGALWIYIYTTAKIAGRIRARLSKRNATRNPTPPREPDTETTERIALLHEHTGQAQDANRQLADLVHNLGGQIR